MSDQPSMPLTPQEAMDFMQRMWNPFGVPVPGFSPPGAQGAVAARDSVSESGGDDRNTRPRRDRQEDLRVARDRKLARHESELPADEHQDDGAAEGLAGGDARPRPRRRSLPRRNPGLDSKENGWLSRCITDRVRLMHGARSSRSSTRRCRTSSRCFRFAAGDTANPNSWRSIRGIGAGARRRRFRAVRIERHRRIPRRRLPGPRCAAVPGRRRTRAIIRRMICEVDEYFDARRWIRSRPGVQQKARGTRRAKHCRRAQGAGGRAGDVSQSMRGDYLAGPLSAADFALYPLLAFVCRPEIKLPDLDADSMLTPQLARWKNGSRRCRISTRRFRRIGGSPSPAAYAPSHAARRDATHPAPAASARVSQQASFRAAASRREAHQFVAAERVHLDDVAGVRLVLDMSLDAVGGRPQSIDRNDRRRPMPGRRAPPGRRNYDA